MQRLEQLEKSTFHRRNDRALLTWNNLNCYVPRKQERRRLFKRGPKAEVIDEIEQPLMVTGGNADDIEANLAAKTESMKKILFNLQGYARPKEILAIMGGSGSGKTTTLNIFA